MFCESANFCQFNAMRIEVMVNMMFRNCFLLQNFQPLYWILVAVCIYRLVMIGIERSETAQKSTLEIRDKFSPRQNSVQEFFFDGRKKYFFQTEFCLRLYLSQTEFVSH